LVIHTFCTFSTTTIVDVLRCDINTIAIPSIVVDLAPLPIHSCNGNGATATPMAMGQQSINHISNNRSATIDQWHRGEGTGALGQEQWQWGNGNGATAFPLRSIDRVDVDVWGAGVGVLFETLFETLVNAQMEVRLKQ
jgi:hypothetical protein